MIRLDPEKLVGKGVLDFGNSDFRLMKTTCCKQFIVYEDGVGHIYYDPNDFQKVCLCFQIDKCPMCSEKNWDYVDIEKEDIPQDWYWAVWET